MENLKISIKAALRFKEHDDVLYRFAIKEFRKEHPMGSSESVWFKGYEVIDENTIRINYQYGGGDMEMDAHWDIKID